MNTTPYSLGRSVSFEEVAAGPLYLSLDQDDTINPLEEASLRRVVECTTIADPVVAIQTAVTTADVALGQDWSQEGRKLLREFGLLANMTTTQPAVLMRVLSPTL